MKRNGQAFIVASIIFSSLLLLVSTSTGPQILGGYDSNNQLLLDRSLEEVSGSLNSILKENRSIKKAKYNLYSFNRFLERRSLERGIEYNSYQLVVLPHREKAIFINYWDKKEVNVKINGNWTNKTVERKESFRPGFSSYPANITVEIPGLEHKHRFDAASPKLLMHLQLDGVRETWEDSYIG